MKKYNALGLILILSAALLLGTVHGWAQPCTGMLELANGKFAPMRCHYQKAAASCFALLFIGFAIDCFKNKRIAVLPIILSGAVVVSFTFDWALGIGVCRSTEMVCQNTALWMRCIGAGVGLCSLIFCVNFSKQL